MEGALVQDRRNKQRGAGRLGNLTTPKSVQKLQMALHAKARAEAGYRFYALYDKISREDILAHAYAQCRSNKGAPGVDGQDFADVEAYGVGRWLGELALALQEETYRPDPISAMSRAHREILHLARLLARVTEDLPSEKLDRYLVRDAQRVIEAIETLVRMHTAQEEDIYEAMAA